MELQEAWKRLLSVCEVSFEAVSKAKRKTGWDGCGTGTVQVEKVAEGVLLFHERGEWRPKDGRQTTFSNVYRWTANLDGNSIRLEHLRFGQANPVYLFDLVPADSSSLESSQPHVCGEDAYAARMDFGADVIRLRWTVTGPKKRETIAYTYR